MKTHNNDESKRLPNINLPEFITEDYKLEGNNLRIIVKPVKSNLYTECPHCKSTVLHKHGDIKRLVRDVNYFGESFEYQVELEIHSPRYKCIGCGKILTASFDSVDDYRKMTNRLKNKIKQESVRNEFTKIARQYGVSDTAVRNCFDEFVGELDSKRKFVTPRVLGIDEVHLYRKMRGVFVDIENGMLLEMTEDRKRTTMSRMISVFDESKIEIVTMDMCRAYRDLVQEALPNAMIVIDKFHVIKLVNSAVDSVRNALCYEIEQTISSIDDAEERKAKLQEYRALEISPYTFRVNLSPLSRSVEDRNRLNQLNRIITAYPKFKEILNLKEGILRVYRSNSIEEAKSYLNMWQSCVPKHDEVFKDFRRLSRTLSEWSEWILNYFVCRKTNAQTEGVNSLIKSIQVAGRGYSFEVLRAKVLYGTNDARKYERPSDLSNGFINLASEFSPSPTDSQYNGVSIEQINRYFKLKKDSLY